MKHRLTTLNTLCIYTIIEQLHKFLAESGSQVSYCCSTSIHKYSYKKEVKMIHVVVDQRGCGFMFSLIQAQMNTEILENKCIYSVSPMDLQPARFLCPQNSPGKNTGVGCHFLLQGIFPSQGSNLGLPDCPQILYCLNHQGSHTNNALGK